VYFGLIRISAFPFVSVGAAAVLLWSLLLGLVYAVGSASGGQAALRYFRIVLWGGALALVGTGVWALATGQWQRFVDEFGWSPLLEMLFGAALLLFVMVWMGMTYVATKLRDESAALGAPGADVPNGSTAREGGSEDA
jgi:branched-subunit amino acid ABC-type transport system permease component